MEGAFRMEREELDRFCSVGEAVMFYEPGGLPEMVSGEVGYGCLLAYLGSADIRRIGSTDLFIGYDSSQGMMVGKYRFFIRGRCFIFARNKDSGLRAITVSEPAGSAIISGSGHRGDAARDKLSMFCIWNHNRRI